MFLPTRFSLFLSPLIIRYASSQPQRWLRMVHTNYGNLTSPSQSSSRLEITSHHIDSLGTTLLAFLTSCDPSSSQITLLVASDIDRAVLTNHHLDRSQHMAFDRRRQRKITRRAMGTTLAYQIWTRIKEKLPYAVVRSNTD